MNENKEQSHTENYDFQHGYQSGLESVEKETYEGYLSSQVNFEWLTRQLTEKRQELSDLGKVIDHCKLRFKEAYDALQDRILKVNLAGKNKDRTETLLAENQESIRQYSEKRTSVSHKYSLFAGIIYLLAGISFVAGDLIISHEIVAYALNIRNNFEAWAFAIGLAMVSVLLKPAYERLIESPYTDNNSVKSKRIYAWFKGITVAFAVATLFILGWFRYEAFKTDKMKEGVNKSIKQLQNQAFDPLNPSAAPSPELTQQIDAKMKTFDILNEKLVNSPWALASFVLSGILFALAGAICLGIAFPVLQCYWQRWLQIDPKLKRLRKEQKRLTTELQGFEVELSEQIVQKNILENDLKLLPNLETLESQKQSLQEEIKSIENETRLAETDARIGAYNDGFGKGSMVRDVINDDEVNQFVRENYFDTSTLANRAKNNVGDKALFSKRPNLRPHQQLRKLISEDFSDGE
ncbi:hypothetical protein LV89_01073 [Arcicella aurantiaca]|uniref:Uncharacterized protein n=1 Tax=Arcicella aurantiaca TaxID=591202 RepID=A0A316EYB5_9BACT|nr:hypothetical protein [Arcicella aurantiaca]PWK28290.1 hypothetical protein LV89_01073 [Arcicella aurantiaca]